MTCILIIWLAWSAWSVAPFLNHCSIVLQQPTKMQAWLLAIGLAIASPVLIALKLRKFALTQVIWP